MDTLTKVPYSNFGFDNTDKDYLKYIIKTSSTSPIFRFRDKKIPTHYVKCLEDFCDIKNNIIASRCFDHTKIKEFVLQHGIAIGIFKNYGGVDMIDDLFEFTKPQSNILEFKR